VTPRVAVIVNPISGASGHLGVARARAGQAAALIAARGLDAEVLLTERRGHARELAEAALGRGAVSVLAWGGDGTVNEVASALAFRDATLGIIPSGSGNGLARELRIPLDPAHAFAVALGGRECRIDAGELDRRLFFNVAGIGLDARVAHCFANGSARRGLIRYVKIAAQELFTFNSSPYAIVTDGAMVRVDALLIAIANARQYGNGALIAPAAALDDGRLDVVVIAGRSPLRIILQAPRLFTGRIASAPGVTSVTAVDVEITSEQPMPYHVDGEPFAGGVTIRARSRPGALRVVVPADAPSDLLASP
jgi:YegS/Rv2252/BmrU family lipid kinase